MARQILQQCLTCQAFSLKQVCPKCSEVAQAAAPLKWSPEDHRAALRRKMKNVQSDEWSSGLPTLPTLEAMHASHEEE
ncbi:MAG: RNA-protein complex protein Nop10 [Candidatus Poseidonia sp.]|nr:RNA-protein complex protein Nop10 [Poseidonia sp.]